LTKPIYSRTGDAMDWYLIGRILGVVYWPALAALVLYGIGWAIATSRPPHLAEGVKRWARVAAVVGFGAMLFVTLREFVT
jgi:hypothetical protein